MPRLMTHDPEPRTPAMIERLATPPPSPGGGAAALECCLASPSGTGVTRAMLELLASSPRKKRAKVVIETVGGCDNGARIAPSRAVSTPVREQPPRGGNGLGPVTPLHADVGGKRRTISL